MPKDISIKALHGKYIVRVLIAFIFWSFFYSGVFPLFHFIFEKDYSISLSAILNDAIDLGGHFHLWYLPMTIGLYLCLPIYKKITESDTLTRYFLILFFVFSSLIPTLFSIVTTVADPVQNVTIKLINDIIDHIEVKTIIGYSGYFILGFVLDTTEITKRQRRIILCLGFLGFAVSFLLKSLVDSQIESQSGNFSVSAVLLSIAVYVLFKYYVSVSHACRNAISKLSKYSFGAYLIHIFILTVMESIGVDCIPVPVIPLYFIVLILVTAVSFSVSLILNKIPFINKWIV